jgi:hypothetical protein
MGVSFPFAGGSLPFAVANAESIIIIIVANLGIARGHDALGWMMPKIRKNARHIGQRGYAQ